MEDELEKMKDAPAPETDNAAQAEEGKNKPSSKERLINRYKAQKPELNWDNEDDNDVDEMAADELDAFDKGMKAYKERDEKLNDLFNKEPRSARIFVEWANGKDPIENLIETFGDDFTEALQSPEGKEKFKTALENWRTGKKAEEEHKKVYDKNIEETVQTIVSFANEKGIDEEEMDKIILKAHQLGSDVLDGKYSPELLEMIYRAGDYDRAVAEAKEEGRITGKNEKIKNELRTSQSKTGLPPTVGDQNDVMGEPQKGKEPVGRIDMLGGIPVRRKNN